jgi:hypothetical protein
MAEATITNSVDVGGVLQNNFTLPTWISRNIGIKAGYILTFDGGTYSTNGIDWSPEGFDDDDILNVIIEPVSGYTFNWIRATGKLTVWVSGGTEYTNSSAISLATYYIVIGKK